MRIYIYPKDVMLITGKSIAAARRKLNQIRDALGKNSDKPVTIGEYCDYESIPQDEVKAVLK